MIEKKSIDVFLSKCKPFAICLLLYILFLHNVGSAQEFNNFPQMIDSHGSIMLFVDAETGKIAHANQAASEFYGYSKEELLSMHIRNINMLSPEQVDEMRQLAASGEDNQFNFVHRLASGELRNVEVHSYPMETLDDRVLLYSIIHDTTEDDQLVAALKARELLLDRIMISLIMILIIIVVLLIRNITQKRRMFNALGVSERSFRGLFDNISEGFALHEIICDESGNPVDYRFIDVNGAFEQIFNIKRDDVVNTTGLDVFPDIEKPWIHLYGEVAITGNLIKIEKYFKTLNKYFEVTVFSPEKDRFATLFFDITEIREKTETILLLENELSRFDRLDLIGEIAASIGHEVRNPITTVRGFLQYYMNKSEMTEYQDTLSLMIDELDRANEIITEFLSFSKGDSVKQSEICLNATIEKLLPLIDANCLVSDNMVKFDRGNIPLLRLNESEIRQIIINLVRNGIDVMPFGGVLTISTYVDHDEVVLQIEDQGTGIPPEHRDKIGRPFFTTKESGAGLGLSVCYSIAKRHDAVIDFTSSNEGTTFYVRFCRRPRTMSVRERFFLVRYGGVMA